MKHIVLFGATGNVGRYLTRHLVQSFPEMQVIAVGRHEPAWMKESGASFVQADVTQPESFAALPQQDVFAVLNFAGVLPAYLSGDDPSVYIRVNTEGALHVLEYARKSGAERVVYSQSVSRYHGYLADDIRVFKPDMPAKFNYTNDHAVYIIAKTAAVELMEHYHQTYGIRTFEIVLPNIYLYDPAEYYYVDGVARPIAYRYMIRRAMAGEPLQRRQRQTHHHGGVSARHYQGVLPCRRAKRAGLQTREAGLCQLFDGHFQLPCRPRL